MADPITQAKHTAHVLIGEARIRAVQPGLSLGDEA